MRIAKVVFWSSQLKWQFRLELSDTTDTNGNRAVRVTILDQENQGVDDLDLLMTAFHHSRGRDVVTVKLEQIGNGGYQCLAPIGVAGWWDFDFAFSVDGKPARVIRTTEVR